MLLDSMCYTCLKENGDLIDSQKSGTDKMSYKHKLMICLSKNLIEVRNMKICPACIKHLRICYDFLHMVRNTQESIRQYLNRENIKNDKCEISSKSLSGKVLQESDNDKNINLIRECKSDSDDSHYFLLEIKNEATVLESFSCVKCNKNYMTTEEYVQHVCDIKKEELLIKNDGLSDEHFTNLEINSNEDEVQKVTKKVKNKSTEHDRLKHIYECEFCGRPFSKQWMLTKHIKQIHNEEKKFSCPFCGKAFKQSYHLREHITMHTGEKNYACTICDKTFHRVSSQRRHIRSHEAPPGHKTKRTPFLCTICGKSFPFSNGVQRHMRIHLGIKRHECHLCKRKFMQSTHLYVHMRTHTGEKPYVCDICGEAFSLNCTLQKHMNTHKLLRKLDDSNEKLVVDNIG